MAATRQADLTVTLPPRTDGPGGLQGRVPVTVIKPLTIESASEASTATNGGGSNREPQNDFIARLGWQTFVSGEHPLCERHGGCLQRVAQHLKTIRVTIADRGRGQRRRRDRVRAGSWSGSASGSDEGWG